jgi:hypothetical protein
VSGFLREKRFKRRSEAGTLAMVREDGEEAVGDRMGRAAGHRSFVRFASDTACSLRGEINCCHVQTGVCRLLRTDCAVFLRGACPVHRPAQLCEHSRGSQRA